MIRVDVWLVELLREDVLRALMLGWHMRNLIVLRRIGTTTLNIVLQLMRRGKELLLLQMLLLQNFLRLYLIGGVVGILRLS
jgi:hypothetical protein